MSSTVIGFRNGLLYPQQIYHFATGSHLNYWDGAQWHWANQNPPPDSEVETYFIKPSAGAITYVEGSRHIFAFYLAHNLWSNYWDGTQWGWANHGNPYPNTVDIFGPPSVITFSQSGKQRIYAFVVIAGQLRVNYWNGSQWKWSNLGHHPDWLLVNSNAQAITYFDGSHQRIYVFAIGGYNLIVCYWNGTQWTWADLGPPPGTTLNKSSAIFEIGPGVLTFSEGTRWIYVFAVGENGHLFTNYWNGSQWTWADQGTPPDGVKVSHLSRPEAISYRHEGVRKFHVFVIGLDGRLYENYWDGSQWTWIDHGTPGGKLKERIAVFTYSEFFTQQRKLHVFVTTANGHYYQKFWNGSQWTAMDQGKP